MSAKSRTGGGEGGVERYCSWNEKTRMYFKNSPTLQGLSSHVLLNFSQFSIITGIFLKYPLETKII